MNSTDIRLDITKIPKSRIDDVDFENLQFGKQHADHMMYCDYIDGEWQTPKIVPYGPMQFEPSAKVFHYGQAVFEGMKAFKDEEGKVWYFDQSRTLSVSTSLPSGWPFQNSLKATFLHL